MNWNVQSKWIWISKESEFDTYGEFVDKFQYSEGNVSFKISVDSNYELYINGNFVDSGQFADFPHYKVYDEFDITRFCTKGINHIAIIVWYHGETTFTYAHGNAACRYELCVQNEIVSYSDENTQSRLSRTYKNGLRKIITSQLGYGFAYDANMEEQSEYINDNLNNFKLR